MGKKYKIAYHSTNTMYAFDTKNHFIETDILQEKVTQIETYSPYYLCPRNFGCTRGLTTNFFHSLQLSFW